MLLVVGKPVHVCVQTSTGIILHSEKHSRLTLKGESIETNWVNWTEFDVLEDSPQRSDKRMVDIT